MGWKTYVTTAVEARKYVPRDVARRRSKGLSRFIEAQNAPGEPIALEGGRTLYKTVYERALWELERGKKTTHWMWFVFPQELGLGQSFNSQVYGLTKMDARAYLNNTILGPRLVRASVRVAKHLLTDKSLIGIFGETDAMKFASCMDLFAEIDPDTFGPIQALVRNPITVSE